MFDLLFAVTLDSLEEWRSIENSCQDTDLEFESLGLRYIVVKKAFLYGQ